MKKPTVLQGIFVAFVMAFFHHDAISMENHKQHKEPVVPTSKFVEQFDSLRENYSRAYVAEIEYPTGNELYLPRMTTIRGLAKEQAADQDDFTIRQRIYCELAPVGNHSTCFAITTYMDIFL